MTVSRQPEHLQTAAHCLPQFRRPHSLQAIFLVWCRKSQSVKPSFCQGYSPLVDELRQRRHIRGIKRTTSKSAESEAFLLKSTIRLVLQISRPAGTSGLMTIDENGISRYRCGNAQFKTGSDSSGDQIQTAWQSFVAKCCRQVMAFP